MTAQAQEAVKCPNCKRGVNLINTEKSPEIYCSSCHISWSMNEVRDQVNQTGKLPAKVNDRVKVGF